MQRIEQQQRDERADDGKSHHGKTAVPNTVAFVLSNGGWIREHLREGVSSSRIEDSR